MAAEGTVLVARTPEKSPAAAAAAAVVEEELQRQLGEAYTQEAEHIAL